MKNNIFLLDYNKTVLSLYIYYEIEIDNLQQIMTAAVSTMTPSSSSQVTNQFLCFGFIRKRMDHHVAIIYITNIVLLVYIPK